jgi:hypothetical protein
MEGPEE